MRSLVAFCVSAWVCALVYGGECSDCKPGKLCEPHAKTEAETLKEQKPNLKAKDVAVRRAAIEKVAALADQHSNATSKEVIRFIALGLADDSLDVRRIAADLLSKPGQDSEEALKALVKASGDAIKMIVEKGEVGAAISDPRGDIGAYAAAAFSGLAKFHDDRSVDALEDALEKMPYSQRFAPPAHAIVDALISLGSKSGLEGVTDIIKQYEGYGTGKVYHDALSKMATDRGLADAPQWTGTGTANAWSKWIEKHPKEFPAKLGKLAATP